MSMLAERRRKTKWVINPTKKPLWATDSNGIKFGKELMEKMGWSAGKGLGAKEQGIHEPLRVSYKNDTKGMGFKGNDDDWIEQQDEFNVLLNQLRNSDDSSVVKVSEERNEIKSLEEKSKQSRARVHYQKFTRGKDLSKYSENDLACILGTNKLKKEKLKTEEVVESEEKTDSHFVTSFGVTTMNRGSIQDYFKKKWINDKGQSKSAPDVENEKEEHSCDERPSFKESLNLESKEYSKKENETEDGGEMNGDLEEKHEKRKKRKKRDVETSEEEEPKIKRKKTSDWDNPVDVELQNTLADVGGNEAETENLLGNENDCDSSRKRKKEKRRSKEDEGNDASEEAMMEVKKKKKRERREKPVENGCCGAEEVASIDRSLEAEHPEREGELVKKKRKGKNEVFGECTREPSLGISVGEMNDEVEGDIVVAKGKKKKEKCKNGGGSVGVEEPGGMNEDLGKVSDVCEGGTVEVGSKKKKKKKEKQDKMECCSNESGISCDILAERNDVERNYNSFVELEQSKKKKKKEDKIECSSNENGISCGILVQENDGENSINSNLELEQRKKKKKKKEDKTECSSNENGISCETQVEKCDNENSPNSTTELEVKKKKKKKEKQDKVECSSNKSELFGLEKCDSENNSNSNVELDVVKRKKKKKEKKQDKVECHSNESEHSGEIGEEKCDGGNSSNSTAELEEVKKKKEKQDKMECFTNESGLSGEISVERCDNGSNGTTELEVKRKKKKDKHKTKEDSDGKDVSETRLEEGCREVITETETVERKKKKKDKKEKHKSKEGSSVDGEEQESKESCPDRQSTNAEVGEGERRRKKREKKPSESEGEEEKEAKPVEDVEEKEKKGGSGGNAEIGTTEGIDRVELISQRAAYEHVAGQHRYERVKKLFESVNLARFRGSNLEYLEGYGKSLKKCETGAR